MMSDLSISEMQELQRLLQEKYIKKWGGLSPEKAIQKFLWMYGELGEAADVIKKSGNAAIMGDIQARHQFIEEMCDALMYFNDVLLCYDITPEEIRNMYFNKFDANMRRW